MSSHSIWGPVTSTIDWCEHNYKFSSIIAEPGNCLSNLSFIIVGLAGAIHELSQQSPSFAALHATVATIGIGSFLFHGTLTVWGQQMDELPMVWFALMYIYVVNRDLINQNWKIKLISRYIIPIYAIVFSVLHLIYKTTTLFQIHFGVLVITLLGCLYSRYRHTSAGKEGKQIVSTFFLTQFLGLGSWLIDYHGCEWFHTNNIYPIGHILWHFFMGYNAFYGVKMLKYFELKHNNIDMDIQYKFGLPFISKKPIPDPTILKTVTHLSSKKLQSF